MFCIFFAVWAIIERSRLDPFYTPLRCTNVPVMLRMSMVSCPPGTSLGIYPPDNPLGIPTRSPPCIPGGTPPCGLHGHVATLSQTCENPNDYDINSKATDVKTVLYLPNLTNQIDGTPLMEVARSYATADVSLKAKRTTMIYWSYNAGLSLATLQSVATTAFFQGYVPIYTHTSGTLETCVRLLGSSLCNKDFKEAWCGSFVGHCVVAVPGTNLSEPALCAFTSSICKETLAELKAHLMPRNVGLEIASTFPCPAATGLPAVMNCTTPSAPGIDALSGFPGKSRPIPGFVDGPHPSQKDIEDGKARVSFILSLTIGLSQSCGFYWFLLSSCIVVKWLKALDNDCFGGAACPGPNILTTPVSSASGARKAGSGADGDRQPGAPSWTDTIM
jgi:hypothetical protein